MLLITIATVSLEVFYFSRWRQEMEGIQASHVEERRQLEEVSFSIQCNAMERMDSNFFFDLLGD